MIERVRPGVVRINTNIGSGSGVIFSKSADGSGLVLTNYHVIEGASTVDVVVGDSKLYRSTIRGVDVERDLAVLSICCEEFTVVALAESGSVPTGAEVVVMGYPLGIAGLATVSRGIVSAVRYESDMDRWVIQTDASINPGNSGGPMLSMSGEFVGIATYKIISSKGGVAVEGVGFAVSGQTLREQLPAIVSGNSLAVLARSTPTPTPAPRRFKLSVNGTEVSADDTVIGLSGGSVKVSPLPDFDGSYAAGTVVSIWAYNNNPRAGGSFNGTDNVDPKGVGSVVMNGDRSIEVAFF